MISPSRRCIGVFAVAVTLSPSVGRAQIVARSFDELQGILKADKTVVVIDNAGQDTSARFAERWYASSTQAAPQGASGKAMTRGMRIAIGAGIGGGVGVVVGEYLFGRKLDMAHGPDMALGVDRDHELTSPHRSGTMDRALRDSR